MRIVVALFYLWLVVSVVLLVRRRLTARGRAELVADHDSVATTWSAPSPAIVAHLDPVMPVLPDLLRGIAMPADLAPLTHLGTGSLDHLVLVTTAAPPDQVTRQLETELVRLGYEVSWSGWGLGRATGDRGAVELGVHDAASTTPEGVVRFPTAPPGSVVVELRPG